LNAEDIMDKKLCMVYNTAPHYRDAIFTALDRVYNCDWYFGVTKSDIKEMDISKLKNVRYYKTFGNTAKLYWQKGLVSMLFKKKYQNFLVLSEVRSLSFWVFMLLKWLFFPGKHVYGWSHGLYGREGRLRQKLERWKTNAMTGLFLYNNYSRQLYIDIGVKPEKVMVIYNSLDYENQLILRKQIVKSDIFQKHFGNSNPTIVFIGRLTESKKLEWLLEALYDLSKHNRLYNVVFVGGGAHKSALELIASEYGLNAWFYGACYDEKTNAEILYNADLCVSPGNVGLTAIHSMMFGTPVITNDDLTHQGPEFEAIKNNITGMFFKNKDIKSLADNITEWFSNHPDRESVRKACFEEIDQNWNPINQINIFRKHLDIK